MRFFHRLLAVLTVLECIVLPTLFVTTTKRANPVFKPLAIDAPLASAVYGDSPLFGNDSVPFTTDDTAFVVCTPPTPAIYEAPFFFGNDLVPLTTDDTALAIYIPPTPTIYGAPPAFSNDQVPSTTDDTALAVYTPPTPATYRTPPTFANDLVPSTTDDTALAVYTPPAPAGDGALASFIAVVSSFLGGLVELMLWLNSTVKPALLELLVFGFELCDDLASDVFEQFIKLLGNKLIKNMSKILDWFDIDLAPLCATVQLLFNGRPNALRIISATSPSVLEKLKTYLEKRSPSAKSRPKAPFEAGPPEPRSEPKSLGLPDSHSEITSSDDLILHGSTTMNDTPEPMDEQLLTEPPVGDTAGAEQDTQPLEPMTNMEREIYEWQFDKLTETLTTIATFPVDDQQPPKNFANNVIFIRNCKSIILLQAEGLVYVRDMVKRVNQGVEDLAAISDHPISKELSGIKKSLEKLEEAFKKQCDIKLLTKNIEFIDDRYLEERLVWIKHRDKVSKTAKKLTNFLAKRQEYTEEFLREAHGLCDIYNDNLKNIMNTSNAQSSP